MDAPGIEWMKSDYYHTNTLLPGNPAQTREESGEDWWYAHENAYNNSTQNGYICAGYSTFINSFYSETNGGCLTTGSFTTGEACTNEYELNHPGSTGNYLLYCNTIFQALSKKDLKGNTQWHKLYNYGFFYRVRQTSDGGYIAFGQSYSTRTIDNAGNYSIPLLLQNPDGTQSNVKYDCSNFTARKKRWCFVKTDVDGNVEWQYLYSPENSIKNGTYDENDWRGECYDIVEYFPAPQNRRHIHFGPYLKQNNLSFINGSKLECTSPLPGTYYNGTGTSQFISMWDVSGVDIINNTINGFTGFNYEDRGVGITAYDADIRAYAIGGQGNYFNDLYHGINGWYTSGITSKPNIISSNVFQSCLGGVYLNGAMASFIHGNRILNIPRPDTDPGFGVWMDGSQLFDINNNNHIEGVPGIPFHGTNYGVVVTNSNNGGRSIDHNMFLQTVVGTQAEGNNPQLDIRCNTFTNHEANAWRVMKDINALGFLKDQGTGTQSQDERPQNTFDWFNSCNNPEAHFYAEYKFKYYVNNFNPGNPTHPKCSSPILVQGSNAGTDDIINSLQNNPEDKCIIDIPCPTLPCDELKLAINNELNLEKQAGLLNELMLAYAEKDTSGNDTLLVEFLLSTKTQYGNKLATKIYSEQGDWTKVKNVLTLIDKITQEDDDFIIYFDWLATKMNGISTISSAQISLADIALLNQIVNHKNEISTLAENLLQKARLSEFKHAIMPLIHQSIRNEVEREMKNETPLLIVTPNPNNGRFQLQINGNIELHDYSINVYDAMGNTVHTQRLVATNIGIDLSKLAHGIYNLVLYSNKVKIGNAKIAVVK